MPNLAVGMDQSGHYLLVVNKDNIVEQRPVTIGHQVNSSRVIEKGLGQDDWVIINGLQLAGPGTKVTPIKALKTFQETAEYSSVTEAAK